MASTEIDDNCNMQINAFSDYALRILMYLMVNGDRLVTSREIATSYDLSFDHIAKAAQFLSRHGYVSAIRGRSGGLQLSQRPTDISIGEVLRLTEAGSGLVECMRAGPTHCKLANVCGLAPLLTEANEAFFQTLDQKTLADAVPHAPALLNALKPCSDNV
ncbi:MAG: Rrf2 family nitric oxide-sensitive transcriptional repressor [Alphaproteobacteria bacterium]